MKEGPEKLFSPSTIRFEPFIRPRYGRMEVFVSYFALSLLWKWSLQMHSPRFVWFEIIFYSKIAHSLWIETFIRL